jgi:hypothetical protein
MYTYVFCRSMNKYLLNITLQIQVHVGIRLRQDRMHRHVNSTILVKLNTTEIIPSFILQSRVPALWYKSSLNNTIRHPSIARHNSIVHSSIISLRQCCHHRAEKPGVGSCIYNSGQPCHTNGRIHFNHLSPLRSLLISTVSSVSPLLRCTILSLIISTDPTCSGRRSI